MSMCFPCANPRRKVLLLFETNLPCRMTSPLSQAVAGKIEVFRENRVENVKAHGDETARCKRRGEGIEGLGPVAPFIKEIIVFARAVHEDDIHEIVGFHRRGYPIGI